MKKRFLALLLAITTILLLCACADEKKPNKASEKNPADTKESEKPFEPKNAKELWEKIDRVMDGLESYGIKQEIKSVIYYAGNKFEIASSIEGITSSEKAEDYYFYMSGENKVLCKELDVDETVEMKEAFYKDKMYVLNKSESVDQRLCASATAEEFLKNEDAVSIDDLDLSACMNQEFSKQKDGTWTLSFSGYTKKSIDQFLEEMSLEEDLGAPVSDMEVVATCDKEFRSTEVTFEFLFDLKDDSTVAPEIFIKISFDRFNDAEFDFDTLLPEEYTEVDDLLVLDRFKKGLEALKSAKKGEFTLNIKEKVTIQGETETKEEDDEISYGEENGSYYYDIRVSDENGRYQLNCRGGTLTITMDGESESGSQSEEEAKALVDGLIDSAKFSSEYVTDVEKLEEDVYLIKIDEIDETYFGEELGEGIKFSSGSQEITLTMKDDKIAEYSATFLISARIRDGATKKIPVNLVIEVTLVVEEVSKTA
ncbi:MAG: hypothetical protein E7580_04610 [Ruminococcaceae bacterium]|nr:hypothetical protein [Oscillospiraceae bacterium]